MADVKPIGKALFLREEELHRGIELMFFAYRDFTGEADTILAEQHMGRAHHRAIYFIGRNPGITVSDLLTILCITKQSPISLLFCRSYRYSRLNISCI